MFYHYCQNNSGGSFDIDRASGIGINVIVEADDWEEANDRAEDVGLYFDDEYDCPCCGPRWVEQYSYVKGTVQPTVYAFAIPESELTDDLNVGDDPDWVASFSGYIHFKDGTVKAFSMSRP